MPRREIPRRPCRVDQKFCGAWCPGNSLAPVQSVAAAYIKLLASRGVEYLFGNAGADFAPVVETYVDAEQTGASVAHPILAAHENLAVSMAHGYAMVSHTNSRFFSS